MAIRISRCSRDDQLASAQAAPSVRPLAQTATGGEGGLQAWVTTMTGKMEVKASIESFQETKRHMNSPPLRPSMHCSIWLTEPSSG